MIGWEVAKVVRVLMVHGGMVGLAFQPERWQVWLSIILMAAGSALCSKAWNDSQIRKLDEKTETKPEVLYSSDSDG